MSFIKRTAKTVGKKFNVAAWMGISEIKKNTKIYANLVQDLLTPQKKTNQNQSNTESSKPMSAAELQSRKKLAIILVMTFTLLGVGLFVYSFYLWFVKVFILPGVPPFVFSFMALGYALQEFMVYMQIHLDLKKITFKQLVQWFKTRKLGQ